MTLYEILGVGPNASADEIKAAYRREVKAHHPDRGGDREKFQDVQRAYDVLSDPDRRTRYDQHGDQNDTGVPRSSVILAQAFGAVVDAKVGGDPIKLTRTLLEKRLQESREALKEHEEQAENWRKMLKRIERLGGDAILESVLEGKIRPHLREAEIARAWIDGVTLALKLIANYRYRSDAAKEFFEMADILCRQDEEEEKSKSKRRRKAA